MTQIVRGSIKNKFTKESVNVSFLAKRFLECFKQPVWEGLGVVVF